MDMQEFIRAMPKVDLNIRLEGAFQRETLLTIAEENDIPGSVKKYKNWVALLNKPDYNRLDELIRTVSGWLRYPDNLARLVYDIGIYCHQQNIRYAEVSVNPFIHMLEGQSFEQFLAALNDGRDRVERGWGVKMNWLLTVPRSEPRHADDTSRSAASAAGRKGGVVGFGVLGREKSQPVGQFERSFNTAHKKDVMTFIQAGDTYGAEGILEAFEHLSPTRLIGGWGAVDAPDVLEMLSQQEIPLVVSMAEALSLGWADNYASYPLRRLYDENVKVVLSADMPTFYNTTLTDEYLAAVEHADLNLDALQEIALNALQYSQLEEDEKLLMIADFLTEYERLREELAAEETG